MASGDFFRAAVKKLGILLFAITLVDFSQKIRLKSGVDSKIARTVGESDSRFRRKPTFFKSTQNTH